MKVTLEQEEIEAALKEYMHNSLGISQEKDIQIEFKAGRGANGLEATIDIQANARPKATQIGTLKREIAASTLLPAEDKEEAEVRQNISSGDEREEPRGAQALLEETKEEVEEAPSTTKRTIFTKP